jgi:hypothetical protein
MADEDSHWVRGLNWIWTNWDQIQTRLGKLYSWIRGRKTDGPVNTPGILVIGPGRTGKTTLARLLTGENDHPLSAEPWVYRENLTKEKFRLSDDPATEFEVFPGQDAHRPQEWKDLRKELVSGKYRGVILTMAFGYHSFSGIGYKEHKLYKGDKPNFLSDLLVANRAEEIRLIEHLRPALESISGKLWVLVVVAKQDLWWPERTVVRSHHEDAAGPIAAIFDAIRAANPAVDMRTQTAYTSLVIANFRTTVDEILKKTAEGYDQREQVTSQRRLLEILDDLRTWEGGP